MSLKAVKEDMSKFMVNKLTEDGNTVQSTEVLVGNLENLNADSSQVVQLQDPENKALLVDFFKKASDDLRSFVNDTESESASNLLSRVQVLEKQINPESTLYRIGRATTLLGALGAVLYPFRAALASGYSTATSYIPEFPSMANVTSHVTSHLPSMDTVKSYLPEAKLTMASGVVLVVTTVAITSMLLYGLYASKKSQKAKLKILHEITIPNSTTDTKASSVAKKVGAKKKTVKSSDSTQPGKTLVRSPEGQRAHDALMARIKADK